MSSNGYLVPPSQNPEREELWNETWKRIDRFLPDLRKDLALDDPKAAEVPPAAAAAATTTSATGGGNASANASAGDVPPTAEEKA